MKQIINTYNNLSRSVKATIWFFVCSFLQKGISALTTPIFTRLMSTSEFGQYNVFNSWLGIITIFVTFGLYRESYTQGLVKYEEQRPQYASTMQGLTLTLCVGWTIIYSLFKDFWNSLFGLSTVQMLLMILLIWTTAVFNFWAAEQRVILNYRKLVLLTILVSFAKPLLSIVLILVSDDAITARIVGLAISELVGYIGLFVAQMLRGKRFFDKFFWKRAIILNAPLILHYLSMTVLSSSDRLMISSLVNNEKAGIYSLAYQISYVMSIFGDTLTRTLSPWIYQKMKANKAYEISSVCYVTIIMDAVVNMILILVAPEIVRIFAPPAYYEAIWVVPPIALSVFFMYCYNIFVKFEFYYEKTQYVMIASFIGATLNVLTNYIFIPIFGYYAAAYTTLACYIIFAVAHYCMMQKLCHKYIGKNGIFNTRLLATGSLLYVTMGLLLMETYKNILVRYAIILIVFLIGIIFRKELIKNIKKLVQMRKDKV